MDIDQEVLRHRLAVLRSAFTGTPDEAVESAIAIYRDAGEFIKKEVAPWEALRSEAKQIISDVMTETGVTSWKTKAGSAIVPAPGMTVSYDAKALDALCASDDAIKRLLWPHRAEKERAGSLTIR